MSDGTGSATGGKPIHALWISMAITVAMFIPCWFLSLHPLTWLMVLFYGPLIVSYQSRDNVVWNAALGGMVGVVVVVAFAALWEASETKQLLRTMGGSSSEQEMQNPTVRLVVGVPFALLTIFPFCLVGSSVGEHLSVWRRKRAIEQANAPIEQVKPRKMTDEEIANTKL